MLVEEEAGEEVAIVNEPAEPAAAPESPAEQPPASAATEGAGEAQRTEPDELPDADQSGEPMDVENLDDFDLNEDTVDKPVNGGDQALNEFLKGLGD